MARRESADLEAKLFDTERKGCLAVVLGPRKRGEIDYERYQDGSARMKIGLKGVPLPAGARRVSVFINDAAVAEVPVERGSGHLRLESSRGDSVPDVAIDDAATVRLGDRIICEGAFHRD